jgi:catechol 2,3-dioxygenase-like lactoylglutathione lyase family enzyme
MRDVKTSAFLHINIRCADVERARHFYEQFVGLTAGDRPPFRSTGYWLYLDNEPLVHLVQRDPADEPHDGSGNIDHIAFRGTDIESTRAALRAAGLPFREAVVPRDGTAQVFLRDPDGIQVELNFESRVTEP